MSYATPQAPAAPVPVAQKSTNGLKTLGIALILIIGTTIAAFIDVFLNNHLTYITGAVFVVLCAICALTVCQRDLWTAVITAPIAYLIALVASGQPEIFQNQGDIFLKQGSLVATGLAFNAPYIFGGTILALVIVLFRRNKK